MPLLGQHDPRYIVIYSDGVNSERMNRSTAISYASIFDGKVKCVEPKLMDKIRSWFEREEQR